MTVVKEISQLYKKTDDSLTGEDAPSENFVRGGVASTSFVPSHVMAIDVKILTG